MILLDENIRRDQWAALIRARVGARQIGYELLEEGIQDDQIIPVLHRLHKPTLFTEDLGLYRAGKVILVMPTIIRFWQLRREEEQEAGWVE